MQLIWKSQWSGTYSDEACPCDYPGTVTSHGGGCVCASEKVLPMTPPFANRSPCDAASVRVGRLAEM